MEVKLFDGAKDVAVLIFSWIQGQAYVVSMPDGLLARTAVRYDHGISWEQKMKKELPRQHRAIIATYGYPLRHTDLFQRDVVRPLNVCQAGGFRSSVAQAF